MTVGKCVLEEASRALLLHGAAPLCSTTLPWGLAESQSHPRLPESGPVFEQDPRKACLPALLLQAKLLHLSELLCLQRVFEKRNT